MLWNYLKHVKIIQEQEKMANKLNKRYKKCYHNNLNKQPVQKGEKVDDWLNPLLIYNPVLPVCVVCFIKSYLKICYMYLVLYPQYTSRDTHIYRYTHTYTESPASSCKNFALHFKRSHAGTLLQFCAHSAPLLHSTYTHATSFEFCTDTRIF